MKQLSNTGTTQTITKLTLALSVGSVVLTA